MAVVAAYLYRNGQRVRAVTIDETLQMGPDRSEFVWIGLCDPTQEELGALARVYGLHPLAVADALGARQLPKIDVLGAQIFVVARTAHLESEVIQYGETAIFVGRHHIISVRHHSDRSHRELRGQLEASPDQLMLGVDYVLHALLNYIVDGYLPILERIEDAVFEMERRSVDAFLGRQETTRIFAIRCQLTHFQRTVGPMAELIRKLVRGHVPCIGADTRPYFSDVRDHIVRVQSMNDGLLHVLASVFEFSSLLEQQRTGVITRQLAAWAAILAMPTAMAGIFGMNFRHIPGLSNAYGFYGALGFIALLCLTLYIRFRRAKWL